MINNIRHKGLAALHWKEQARGVSPSLVKRLRQVLALLETAKTAEDMNLPGLRLHALKGDMKGLYSVYASANWRVVFRFENGNAQDVDLIDYH